jgi:hypothetical protein
MEKVMGQAYQVSVGFGYQGVEGFVGIEEACPGYLSDLGGKCGGAGMELMD